MPGVRFPLLALSVSPCAAETPGAGDAAGDVAAGRGDHGAAGDLHLPAAGGGDQNQEAEEGESMAGGDDCPSGPRATGLRVCSSPPAVRQAAGREGGDPGPARRVHPCAPGPGGGAERADTGAEAQVGGPVAPGLGRSRAGCAGQNWGAQSGAGVLGAELGCGAGRSNMQGDGPN